jgi:hypothetical protein
MVITNTTQQVVGDEMHYAFDMDTGDTLVKETTFLMSDSEYLVNFQPDSLIEEWITELPEEAADLLAQAEAILAHPEQATGSYTWNAPTPTPDPNPQTALASATLYGVTLSVIDISSESGNTVTTLAQIDPEWEMDVNAFPPQQALTYLSSLSTAMGRPLTLTQSTGQLAEMDVATGGIQQGYTHSFTGDLGADEELVLTTAVDLSSLHRVITLPLSLVAAEVGQTWALNWRLPVGEAELIVTEVTWQANNDSGEAQLRLKVVDNSAAGLEVTCLYIALYDPWQETCANFDGEKEYVIMVPQDDPIMLHVRIDLSITGFELRWQP